MDTFFFFYLVFLLVLVLCTMVVFCDNSPVLFKSKPLYAVHLSVLLYILYIAFLLLYALLCFILVLKFLNLPLYNLKVLGMSNEWVLLLKYTILKGESESLLEWLAIYLVKIMGCILWLMSGLLVFEMQFLDVKSWMKFWLEFLMKKMAFWMWIYSLKLSDMQAFKFKMYIKFNNIYFKFNMFIIILMMFIIILMMVGV